MPIWLLRDPREPQRRLSLLLLLRELAPAALAVAVLVEDCLEARVLLKLDEQLPARPAREVAVPAHEELRAPAVAALAEEFPTLLTPFATFLEETGWGNATATYDDLATLL